MSKKIRRLIVLAIISASMAFATGCGAGSDGATAESTVADTGSTGATKSENLDSLLGEWVKIASMGEDYYSSAVDIESEGTLDIYVEDGYYKVDYVENENVYGEYYGIKIYEVEKPDYPGNDAAP